jgi:CRP/FNR family transcriptional regulator
VERLSVNEKTIGSVTSHLEVSCDRCGISSLCLPGEMGDSERSALNQIVQRARPLRKGAFLFRAGEKSDSVYALRTGSLKS